jgi:iron uptake system component EfeO
LIHRKLAAWTAGATVACLLSGCSASSSVSTAPTGRAILITVTADTCGATWGHPSPGLQTFQIHNASSIATDIALTNAQTGGVYAEVEELGPGVTRSMQVDVGSGSYAFQCDNESGGPIIGSVTVVPGNVPGEQAVVPADVSEMLSAVTRERTYETNGLATVAQQAAVLAVDIEAGNLTAARSAWLTAHLSWERLGSAYGMFGNYDDAIDGDPNGLPDGVNDPGWTGFYRIEYGLWHGQSAAELTAPVQRLVSDIKALRTAYPGMVLYPQAALSDLALRTHEILEHAVRFQLSGADDFGSGTTLATADANIDATRNQLAMLKPLLISRYPQLGSVYIWLNRLQSLVDATHTGSGWTPVSGLSITQREGINSAAAETVQLLAPIAVLFESSPLP